MGGDIDRIRTAKLSRVDKMRLMCMCGVLRDAKPPNPLIQSIRGSTSSPFTTTSTTTLVEGTNVSSLLNDPKDSTAAMIESTSTADAVRKCVNGKVSVGVGAEAISYPCSNIDMLSFLTIKDLSISRRDFSDTVSSLWGWTDGVHEIAMVGMSSGVAFVDITTPTDPIFIGKLPPPRANGRYSFWRDIKVYKDHAYMVSEAGNMQYVDMTKIVALVDSIALLPSFQTGIELTPYAKEFGNITLYKTHTLALNEDSGYAYLVGSNLCSGGLYMVDVRVPSNPKDAGCFGDDGYVHEVQCTSICTVLCPGLVDSVETSCYNKHCDTVPNLNVSHASLNETQ